MAVRMSLAEFCREVERAVRSLPPVFQAHTDNLVVDVEEWPDPDDLPPLEPEDADDDLVLGLFVGTPITEQEFGLATPNRVIIYRQPILEISDDRSDVVRHIRDTVLHEMAHHFGFSEEDLEPFEQSRWIEEGTEGEEDEAEPH